MKVYSSITQLIGKTPIVKLNKLAKDMGIQSDIYVKLEYMNPLSSVKDRVALALIEGAEKAGKLQEGAVVIEATSGNTGIGLAGICAIKGYKLILVMPQSMSVERRKILAHLGAEIVLTPADKGMQGSVDMINKLLEQYPNAFIPSQFTNQDNVNAHKLTTGVEIADDLDDDIDYFVAGVGTGGTLTGSAITLKERIPKIKIVAVEPQESPLLSKNIAGAHGIQGIGANFVPEILDKSLIDEIITVTTSDAIECAKQVAKTDALLVGISSGAAIAGAIQIAKQHKNKKIVVILPDTAERYLSTPLFD